MRFFKLIVFISIFFLFTGANSSIKTVSCKEILAKMLDSIKAIKTQQYYLKATERVENHLLFAESIVKINEYPKKIYFKSLEKNVEVLWITGANKGNAIVHSKNLPFINMDLDPYGAIMRKNQHHTIFDLGFHYIGQTLAATILQSSKTFDKHFSFAGTLTWDKKECFQLLISYPDYKWIQHITKKGETVTHIAKLYNTSDFKIRYKNDLSSYFGTIKEGKQLLVPVPYSNRAILFIDKKTCLPINLKVYDEEGLFEAYEFYNIQINKSFAENEFSTAFKDYNFKN